MFSKLYNPASDALDKDAGGLHKDGRVKNEEHNPDSNVSHFAISQSENYDQWHNQKQMTIHNVSQVNSEPDEDAGLHD